MNEATTELPVETLARIAHEVIRLYCLGLGEAEEDGNCETAAWERLGKVDQAVMMETVEHCLRNPEAANVTLIAGCQEDPPEQQFKTHLLLGIVNAALGR